MGELEVLHQIAGRLGVIAPVMLRVNPDVSVDSPHPYIRTGEHGMKFGIPDDQVVDVARATLGMPHVVLVGLAAHLGSQIPQAEPYATTLRRLCALCEELRAVGITTLQYLDLGGGLAVGYRDDASANLADFTDAIRSVAQHSGMRLFLEPGRYIVADAGVLLTRVLYRKHSGGKEIVITDAGMNDLIRPALYEAYHAIEPVRETEGALTANVVGPVCESGDFFASDREIGSVSPGDLLAIRTSGAYGFVMSSNYNSRPRSAEVLVDGARFAVVTRRETYDDLVRHETLTPDWKEA
jgi:diaminopimelate decarboxylase